ncbi:DNA polymerase III subunit gamma/tau [Membranicola marinus]|uniref:DNA polymerase III subunit gamma/tau n=1 Tax=Membranihabitans marinus TaxID=1227546 RepID=A0A953HXC1_9BACT|nr:DNA polymerase III subunit gamma/tau [Membranihabitans marinus]MBY5959871.1 DNA polymerase III subunit gamma/tau [Membranihabitans marinus]
MSQFIVSARKYRPQRFDDVVGQDHITTTLKNAIRQNKVAHAFLFCGPRGVGKTTTARILAKTINCENITEDYEACGICASCVAFQKKNAPNIIELDAASNNSVEYIRNLNEQVRIPPAQGNYKLFIIDEVHMLSLAAFNAFLKTLEEPPPFAIFILATTEKHKILPTILSRCQIYDFKRNKVQDIIPHLANICDAEELKYDQEALHLIAEKADGALRDALSIFDRMVSFSDGNISYESVIDQLNILDYDYFFTLVDHLIVGDLSSSYLLFNQILEKGFNPEVFLQGLQEHLRQLLMIQLGNTAFLVNGSQDLLNRYTNQANQATRDFLLTLLDLANECDVNYRFAQNKRLHVEISLMKMAYFPHARQQDISGFSSPGETAPPSKKNGTKSLSSQPTARTTPTSGPRAKTVEETKSDYKTSEKNPVKTDQSARRDAPAPTKEEPRPPAASTSHSQPSSPATGDAPSPTAPESTTPSKKSRRRARKLLPTLDAMDEIIEEVEQNDANNQVVPDDDELIEMVQKTWKNFAENNSSPSLVSFLKDAELRWADDKLFITVTSQLAKSSILDQRTLFEQLRDATAPLTPEIVFVIKPSDSAAKKAPKILTTKDKYEALRKANPNLENLIKELNMKVEDI